MENINNSISELTWADVRKEVKQVNPKLAKIIDELSPSKKYKFVKVTYKFGDLIVNKGTPQLPLQNGKLTSITSNEVSQPIKTQLSYSAIPLSLLLNKASEIFLMADEKTLPLNVISPGSLFGLFETMDFIFSTKSSPIWYVSAGCRTIFTLPKISEASGLKRLKVQYRLPSEFQLKQLSDHFHVFKVIANHTDNNPYWQSQVLMFGKDWFENRDDPSWFNFFRFLFADAWIHSKEALAKRSSNLLWQVFIKSINKRNLKPEPYLADTVKNLLLIAEGSAPGFCPTDDTDLAAPVATIQTALKEVYLLKQYTPTIMQPSLLNETSRPVYYSLSFPTLLEGTPVGRNTSSTIMIDQREIKYLIDTFYKYNNEIVLPNTFDYFHVENDPHNEIISSRDIPAVDKRFFYSNEESFCATSPFWRGTIRIDFNID